MALAHANYEGSPMNTGKHVRFFRNGRNQAIRIPREFELDAEEAIIRREDDRLVIEPIRKKQYVDRCVRSGNRIDPGDCKHGWVFPSAGACG